MAVLLEFDVEMKQRVFAPWPFDDLELNLVGVGVSQVQVVIELYFARVFEAVVQLLDEKVQHESPTFGSIAQSNTRSLLSSVFLGFSIQIVFNHLYYREIMSHKFLCVLLEPTVQKTTVKT